MMSLLGFSSSLMRRGCALWGGISHEYAIEVFELEGCCVFVVYNSDCRSAVSHVVLFYWWVFSIERLHCSHFLRTILPKILITSL